MAGTKHKSDEFFAELEGKISQSQAFTLERHLRSEDYCIAESWAVAAEFGNYGDGAHCFQAGAVARKIAAALHFESSRCVELELACRLHDIGKVGIPSSLARRVPAAEWHNSLYLREHSLIGERLLRASTDPTLFLASKIARSHHEWWNGFGYPDALSETEIPIEARICAVASEYTSLISGNDSETRWLHDEAVNQIVTMAGVQFDPSVVHALLSAENLKDHLSSIHDEAVKLQVNKLKAAKLRLDACLSSI